MTTLIKTSKAGIKIPGRRNTGKTKKLSEQEISNSILDLFNRPVSKQVVHVVKTAGSIVNKYWMRDWMEQLNFLKADQEILVLAKHDQEDFCYYAELVETV
jgi:hypothetical protein